MIIALGILAWLAIGVYVNLFVWEHWQAGIQNLAFNAKKRIYFYIFSVLLIILWPTWYMRRKRYWLMRN